MKRTFKLAMIVALCGLLSSCKKPISGQVFVVTEAGANFPLGAIEVAAISGKDADDFMRHRQAEIESERHSLQKALSETKTKYAAAVQSDSQAQSALTAAENNEKAFGPKYAALLDKKTKELQTIKTLTVAIDQLNDQLSPGGSKGGTATSQRDEAYATIQTDEDSCRDLRRNVDAIDGQLAAIKNTFLNPYRAAQSGADKAVGQAQANVDVAAAALKCFPTANDYFDGFAPGAIETTVTDAEGNFILQHIKSGAKIFAKAQRQTSGSIKNYFWLVDLPSKGSKLILNNNNLFSGSGGSATGHYAGNF